MSEIRWKEFLIRPCQEQNTDRLWHPKARVFWNEGNTTHEQELEASEGVAFKTAAEAEKYAINKLAIPWIDERARRIRE